VPLRYLEEGDHGNMSKLLEKLYALLYLRVGGKPWTEIVREDQRRSPLLYMLIFLGLWEGQNLCKLHCSYSSSKSK